MAKSRVKKTSKKQVIEFVDCNLCGKDDYAVVYKGTPIEELENLSEKFSASSHFIGNDQIVKSKNCGLMYVNPRLKQEYILQGYSEAVDNDYVSQARERTVTFKHGMEFIEKYYSQKGRLLDVGCAAGFFLKVAQERGWDTQGVEPSAWLAKWGRDNLKLKIKTGTLKQAKFKSDSFDAVTIWDVLEHTTDPSGELKEANRILKKGGIVAINFPNIGSNLAKLFGRKWWFILSMHLYYFTPQTISEMLRRNGFEPVIVKRHFQKLKLGYLIYRMQPYSKFFSNLLGSVVNALGLQDAEVTYYASQSIVLARKT